MKEGGKEPEEWRDLEKEKVVKHSSKYDTPSHIHVKIRNMKKDQEKVKKEHPVNISVNDLEEMEGRRTS